MEAEVGLLNRRVEALDYNCNSLQVEELREVEELQEVEKLQALVRTLQRQNRQLRGNRQPPPPPNVEYHEENNNNTSTTSTFTPPSGVSTTVLDHVEELDLDGLFSSSSSSRGADDETWLYVSSRAGVCVDSPPLSPLQWCRQVLDSPRSGGTPPLHLRRVSRWRPSFSSPSPSSPLPGRVAPPALAGSTPLFSRRPASPMASPLLLSTRRSPSPLLKEPLPPAGRSPTFLPHLARRGRRPGPGPERPDDDDVSMDYKLHDLVDVQVMARLQEESLRQDYASAAPRRERRRRSLSLRRPLRPEEEEEEVFGLLSPPPLRLPPLPRPRTFSSAREWRRGGGSPYTPPDTPPASPAPTYAPGPFFSPAATGPQGPGPGSDKLRRSMPDLVRAPSMPSGTTSANHRAPLSLLRNSLSFDSSAQFLSSIQNQVHSVGCFSSPGQPPKATAYVSPTVKGSVASPTGIPPLGCKTPARPAPPRSGLPRPAASSARIAASARGLLTPPRSLAPLSALPHASWKDGCY